MALGMPSINITFKQLAATAVTRSARGILALVIKDDSEGETIAVYTDSLSVSKSAYTDANKQFITQAFWGTPAKVYVVKLKESDTTAQMQAALDGLSVNWLTCASAQKEDQEAIVAYVKARNASKKSRKVKGLVFNATITDDIHVVNLTTPKATWTDSGQEVDGWALLPRLAGLLAGLPLSRSATYYPLPDVSKVTEPADLDAAVDNGEFFLFNDDDGVKIARAVNSLQNVTTDFTEDMKSIAIVEGMDLMLEDIKTTFKNDYLGNYKNSYDNQCLFIAAVNGYLKELAKEEILDPNYNNLAGVDVEAQRNAWIASNKPEASNWDEQTVKNNTFKRHVYLAGNVKMLDAMEDLDFPITMM